MNLSLLDTDRLEAIVLGSDQATAAALQCRDGEAPIATRQRRLRHALDAAHELLVRRAHQALVGRRYLNAPDLVKKYLATLFAGAHRELFVVVFLDAHLRVIDAETLFTGTLTQTSVYPREVVSRALHHAAAAVVLSHNHPSGVAEPSPADEVLTQALKSALALVDVRVVDHVVVAGESAVSFAERGLV